MPVYARESGAWVEQVPRARSSGAWTDADDELYVRDGGAWELIYPDPASVSALLPVEGLAVTAGPDHNSVTIGWTNPTQPSVTPTDVQVRLAELGAVWTEQTYPITSFSWAALDASTAYFAQVRLIRRVDGVITHTSATKSVEFTTTAAPVGAPAPDPGGTGGDSIFDHNVGIGGGGAGTGDPVSTVDGCWYEYKIEIVPLDSLSWQATGITGTFSGALDSFSYDTSALDPTRVYRLCIREACDTTSDGVADTFGDWNCGDPFPGLADWGAICGGFSDSPSIVALSADDDAVFRFPRFCKDAEGAMMVLTEAVSGVEIGKGPGFRSFFMDSNSEAGVAPLETLTSAPFYSTMNAPIADLPTMMVNGGDWTVMTRFRALSTHTGSNGRVVVVASYAAFLANFKLTESATGWTPSFTVVTSGGVQTITGTEIAFDTGVTHTLTARWDDDAELQLWVDGAEVGTGINVSALTITTAATTGVVTSQAAGVANMQQLGWSRALTDVEITSFTRSSYGTGVLLDEVGTSATGKLRYNATDNIISISGENNATWVNVSNPEAMTVLTTKGQSGASGADYDAVNDYIASGGDNFNVWSANSPFSVVSSYSGTGGDRNAAFLPALNQVFFLRSSFSQLASFDPATGTLDDSHPHGVGNNDLVVDEANEVVYVVGGTGIAAIDVSTVTALVTLDTLLPAGASNLIRCELDRTNSILYVVDLNANLLYAVDVSDPSNMVLLDSISTNIDTPRSVTLDLVNNWAYVLNQGVSDNVTIYDISDPSNLAYEDTFDPNVDVAPSTMLSPQGILYASDLQVLFITDDQLTNQLQAYDIYGVY